MVGAILEYNLNFRSNEVKKLIFLQNAHVQFCLEIPMLFVLVYDIQTLFWPKIM